MEQSNFHRNKLKKKKTINQLIPMSISFLLFGRAASLGTPQDRCISFAACLNTFFCTSDIVLRLLFPMFYCFHSSNLLPAELFSSFLFAAIKRCSLRLPPSNTPIVTLLWDILSMHINLWLLSFRLLYLMH